MTLPAKEMHSYLARLETFQQLHQLSKRRASSQSRKKNANTVQWPHEHPDPNYLAKAGFFYRPATDSTDNVQCFLCTVKLDGWEPTDDPIKEHLAHSKGCAWATAWSVTRNDGDEPEMRDPMCEELSAARTATFSTGDGWTHEGKKGWKCKASKMVEAGWCWDPAAEGEEGDGVTCFYCNLSLDGWEPKDDPFQEHKRRAPECRFFELLEHYHGADAANGKMKKSKVKAKAGARTSTASKTSRMSTQSAVSAISGLSDFPSIPGRFDVPGEGSLAGADDSIITTGTNTSSATTTKGRKKTTRTKAAASDAKSRKKAAVEEEEANLQDPASLSSQEDEILEGTAKAKRSTRASKQVDSSVVEISYIDVAPAKKATRGRKGTAQPDLGPETVPETPDAVAIAQQRLSEVSNQLQEELDNSVIDGPLDTSTPRIETKEKRGVKRTSDGTRKEQQTNLSAIEVEVPVMREAKAKTKGNRGRPKKASSASTDADIAATQLSAPVAEPQGTIELGPQEAAHTEAAVNAEAEDSKAVAKKGKGRPRGSKHSTARSSRSSKTTAAPAPPEAEAEELEDPEKDEIEIEQELERIAAEQASQGAIATEHEQAEEFEPSPSSGRVSKDSTELQQLRDEVHAVDANIAQKDFASQLHEQSARPDTPGHFPSPSGSDKENVPSSVVQPSAKQAQPAIILSPTKTTRIPLAASTPNCSPAKMLFSPSKQLSHLVSSAPWIAADLESVLVPSPQASPGKLSSQLAAAAGVLASPEKKMSVEQWVRHRAQRGEEELRKRCEQMVATFEKEGMRAVESLSGIRVVS
ncbi:hypothetical protein DOTSEDRAFT_169130 [Dothistroma septosporum NZE10]|uniref:BIR-domain-containing protein n=1 Tax=Dothistroma septosporum (strain NZE10 / CBS 128990) TaxID=675120 RepID=N1PSR2_DOTSN|nr:hypothetical protein DOTSEDRAFT_169130 [Dothistroma septosporum NZE10]